MKILVTGAVGFIGFHLCEKLLEDKQQVLGIDNINNYYDVNLKKNRLKQLISNKSFKFKKIDISDNNFVKKIYSSVKNIKIIKNGRLYKIIYSITLINILIIKFKLK